MAFHYNVLHPLYSGYVTKTLSRCVTKHDTSIRQKKFPPKFIENILTIDPIVHQNHINSYENEIDELWLFVLMFTIHISLRLFTTKNESRIFTYISSICAGLPECQMFFYGQAYAISKICPLGIGLSILPKQNHSDFWVFLSSIWKNWGHTVVKQKSNWHKSVNFVIYCAAYRTERHFSLVYCLELKPMIT